MLNAFTTLFDAQARRQRQVASLTAEIKRLEAEYEEATDDKEADRIFARIEKARAEMRAAQAAIALKKRQVKAHRESEDAARRQAEVQSVVDGLDGAMKRALVFQDVALSALVKAWKAYETEFEEQANKARALGLGDMVLPECAPQKVWLQVFRRFTAMVHRDERPPMLLPQSASRHDTPDALDTIFAKAFAELGRKAQMHGARRTPEPKAEESLEPEGKVA